MRVARKSGRLLDSLVCPPEAVDGRDAEAKGKSAKGGDVAKLWEALVVSDFTEEAGVDEAELVAVVFAEAI